MSAISNPFVTLESETAAPKVLRVEKLSFRAAVSNATLARIAAANAKLDADPNLDATVERNTRKLTGKSSL